MRSPLQGLQYTRRRGMRRGETEADSGRVSGAALTADCEVVEQEKHDVVAAVHVRDGELHSGRWVYELVYARVYAIRMRAERWISQSRV